MHLEPLWRRLHSSLSIIRFGSRAVSLVWQTSHSLTLVLAFCTLISGILPAAIAYVGKLIVDAVVTAAQSGSAVDQQLALIYVLLEAGIVAVAAASRQGLTVSQSLLRVLLGERVNEMILEKALTLELHHFENAEIYDKMTRARQEASSRPLGFVIGLFGLVERSLSLLTFGGLLLSFSGWATGILVLAAVPPFLAESRFAGEAFLIFRRRTPETRQQRYLEHLIAHEDSAREVKLYQLGSTFLDRYRAIFARLWAEGRDLTLRRGGWSYGLSLLSTLTFYGAYGWIVFETIGGRISLGDMTMYVTVFRQGQTTLSALLSTVNDLYESTLYLATLYEFLEEPISSAADGVTRGSLPGDGIRFEGVSFIYPDADKPALEDIWLHLKPGEKLALVGKNGSGKTTLINLLTRMYTPTKGLIRLDGTDLQRWDVETLHRRIGVIFQTFVRYEFTAGENIGVGDVDFLDNEPHWRAAAAKGMAAPIVEAMPQGYHTPLGRWLQAGSELSGGQWQKMALSRAFMRQRADILVMDEPTAAMDAEAEVEIFERVRALSVDQMAILISHRFSTVRMADRILVMEQGRIAEEGSHLELLALGGRYAHLFSLQAAGYR
ncbi:MAG: ABC transporter ATP-binding protein [Synechococcaceae cyanobacterium RM1_1_27]|nr:ABC transporter ATP-binding protein [Synechococcaceae cyanobacterium RM1_1_27]